MFLYRKGGILMTDESIKELLREGIGLSEEVEDRDNLSWFVVSHSWFVITG